jgi:hypothetical protein
VGESRGAARAAPVTRVEGGPMGSALAPEC